MFIRFENYFENYNIIDIISNSQRIIDQVIGLYCNRLCFILQQGYFNNILSYYNNVSHPMVINTNIMNPLSSVLLNIELNLTYLVNRKRTMMRTHSFKTLELVK